MPCHRAAISALKPAVEADGSCEVCGSEPGEGWGAAGVLAVVVAWPAALAAARVRVWVDCVVELPQPASSTRRITAEALRNGLSGRRADRFDLGVGIGQALDAL